MERLHTPKNEEPHSECLCERTILTTVDMPHRRPHWGRASRLPEGTPPTPQPNMDWKPGRQGEFSKKSTSLQISKEIRVQLIKCACYVIN